MSTTPKTAADYGYTEQDIFPPFSMVLNPCRTRLPGRHDASRVFVTVDWDGRRLSMTGVEGPRATGSCHGGAGQIADAMGERFYVDAFQPGWDQVKVDTLLGIWSDFHLNDMRAGCAHQRALGWKVTRFGDDDMVGQACPECGYRYGSQWLTDAVPTSVLHTLQGFPVATVAYPWRR